MKRMQRMLIRTVAALVLVLCWGTVASAQLVQVLPADITRGLQEGSIHVAIEPAFSGDTLKAFDGNKLTAYETTYDSMRVTLTSAAPVKVQKAKISLWMTGTWKLESADSLGDLEGHKGTYAKLVDGRSAPGFSYDSTTFAPTQARVIRLTVRSTSVYLAEMSLFGAVTFTKIVLAPNPVRIIPGASLKMTPFLQDESGRTYPNFLTTPMLWSATDATIASIDENGTVTGMKLGTAAVGVTDANRLISGTAPVQVLADFKAQKVAPMTIKVALVLHDPAIASQGYAKLHMLFYWRDPVVLSNRLVELFKEASDSVINFQLVETVNATRLFTRLHGTTLSITQYYNLLKESNWTTLKAESDSGHLEYDYREMVKFYNYDTRRNNGEIDEVWVFAAPYMAMGESQLMGPTAFWWNSSPIKDGTALTKLLSVMGLNYERGVDQAFHSFGHRMESAVRQVYNEVLGKPWNTKSTSPSMWDLFTRIEKDVPGLSHVGNIHFPPNGTKDYEYNNATLVPSFAQNWFRYPALFDQHAMVNVNTWLYSNENYPTGDPLAEGNDHLGYLRWWYNHIPRYVGVTDGILNNWWHYWLDYDAADVLAKNTPISVVGDAPLNDVPSAIALERNYPNPFNPSTTISFVLEQNGIVSLRVYNLLGQEVASLVDGPMVKGRHSVTWHAASMPSGVYCYRLQTGSATMVRKMVLVK